MDDNNGSQQFDSLDEMLEYYDSARPWYRKATDWIYYPVTGIWYKVQDFFRMEIKFFVQRGLRGYSDRDVWSINWFLADILPPMLRQLKDTKHGTPIEFCEFNEDNDVTNEETAQSQWESLLTELAEGFELAQKMGEDPEAYQDKKNKKKLSRTFQLFEEHFFNLWD